MEEWRPVVGWEGFYEVSDLGRVRSVDRFVHGRVEKGRVLKQHPDHDGYLHVGLRCSGGGATKKVHNLVLCAFQGPKPFPGAQCRHLDGLKTDNRNCRLKWGTPLENHEDKVVHGTAQIGEKHGMAKLTAKDVLEIRGLFGVVPHWKIACSFGVKKHAIDRISEGKSWRGL